jgi:hypothetical protein
MRTRTLALAALLVATAGSALAQTPPSTPQPGTAPRARGGTPPAEPRTLAPPAEPRILTPPAAAPAAPERPRREGQAVNIKVEFTITDQRGGAPPTKRTLSLIVADERTGFIRTQASAYRMSEIPLNVDASPSLLSDGKIRLGFNLQYDWPAPIEQGKEIPVGSVTRTTLHDSLTLILESGKAMVAAQSADPIGDRQVTVEVKATVLR